MVEVATFYLLAFLISLTTVMVVVSRNPVTSAIYLVVDLFLLATVFASLDAHFAAAIQVLVYAGAIVVLFLFVIMLLNLQPEGLRESRLGPLDFGVLAMTIVGMIMVACNLNTAVPVESDGAAAVVQGASNTKAVAVAMFTKYLWPFELASILILLAVVAAVVIAKKEKATRS